MIESIVFIWIIKNYIYNFRKNVYMFLMVVGKLIFWFIFDENADHRTWLFAAGIRVRICLDTF